MADFLKQNIGDFNPKISNSKTVSSFPKFCLQSSWKNLRISLQKKIFSLQISTNTFFTEEEINWQNVRCFLKTMNNMRSSIKKFSKMASGTKAISEIKPNSEEKIFRRGHLLEQELSPILYKRISDLEKELALTIIRKDLQIKSLTDEVSGMIEQRNSEVDDHEEEISFYKEKIQTQSTLFEQEIKSNKEQMQNLCDGWAIERERNKAEIQKCKENIKKLCQLLKTKDCVPSEPKAIRQESNEAGLLEKKGRPPDTESGGRSTKK